MIRIQSIFIVLVMFLILGCNMQQSNINNDVLEIENFDSVYNEIVEHDTLKFDLHSYEVHHKHFNVLFNSALNCCNEDDSKRDYELAFSLFTQALDFDFLGMVNQVIYDSERLIVEDHFSYSDFQDVFSKFSKDSETKNDADAMFFIGFCYLHGLGVYKDVEEALKWYEKSALLNNTEAMVEEGRLYNICNELSYSEKSLRLYEKAAKLGNKGAMCILGQEYGDGGVVEKDPKKSFYWHYQSAHKGHPTSMCYLAKCYIEGYGVEKDIQKARYWVETAAKVNVYAVCDFLDNDSTFRSTDMSDWNIE